MKHDIAGSFIVRWMLSRVFSFDPTHGDTLLELDTKYDVGIIFS